VVYSFILAFVAFGPVLNETVVYPPRISLSKSAPASPLSNQSYNNGKIAPLMKKLTFYFMNILSHKHQFHSV
jgi:hypothetical protein